VALIETIILGYPIPEVYLWQTDTDPETGDTLYSIVDGQQRLGAVIGFINDEFKLSKTGLDNKDSEYAGKLFSKLTPELKSKIWKYSFSVRFISEKLSKENIVKLFLRLNRTNATLNPQELRNAEFSGKFIRLSDEISRNEFWSKFSVFNQADIRRMNDIQFISTLLIFLRLGIEEETTQTSINRVYDLYNEEYPEAEDDKDVFIKVLDVLVKIAYGKEFTSNIIKRKTHLYTLFVFSYYIYRVSGGIDLDKVSESVNLWFDHYLNETEFADIDSEKLLNEYRVLSQEGVQKRVNRQRRFEILKEFCDV
jgi:hypothetical protein